MKVLTESIKRDYVFCFPVSMIGKVVFDVIYLFNEPIWHMERAWILEIQNLVLLPPSCVILGLLFILPE